MNNTTHAGLGKTFIRWGLNMFLTGFWLGLVPVAHYIHGAVAGDVGEHFMKNMTLWWGCPAVLMELTLKTGGLGMIAIGLCYIVLSKGTENALVSNTERRAPTICTYGLVGGTLYAGIGYVVCNMIWPNFYFEHNEVGKNIWLAGQGVGIAAYIFGLTVALRSIKRNYL